MHPEEIAVTNSSVMQALFDICFDGKKKKKKVYLYIWFVMNFYFEVERVVH